MNLLQNIDSPADLRHLRPDQLQTIADEIRQHILETMSRVGGHTGASLGAVELAVALHYAFDTPRDRLVWDVGHQAYAHKILTGRRDLLPTIKQYGGLSAFLRRDESEFDTFGAGHASTSISAALGMAIARDRKGEDHHVVALIGDASLAGGMAMEAINQAGHLKTRLIVLLNDNEMSIAPAVGALTGYLNRIRESQGYHRFKEEVEETLLAIPSVGGRLHHAAKTMKDAIVQGLQQAYLNLFHMIAEFLPRLVVMLAIILSGLLVAYALKYVVRAVLRLTKLDRLSEEAKRLREEARLLPPGALRNELIRRARQAEAGSHMSEWLRFPRLQSPK